ncbi:GlxA family transcriptional regulator [Kiloniella laminariae]|uniref:GlxA family transcriptional regulator n=2 Tax=Kiloniella laminariae TaxID=454162 RepID=A0ABT4LLI7_9PROT|nr:GlxA family transcriptional regulator [Kiloniella laminariae]
MLDFRYEGRPINVKVLLMPEFPQTDASMVIDVMRVTNRVSGREIFRWQLLSEQGGAVTASNGTSINNTRIMSEEDMADTDMIIVCASYQIDLYTTSAIKAWLRKADRKGIVIGGVESASYVLILSGLIRHSPTAIHWEMLAHVRERYPEIDISNDPYEIHGKRFSSAGGTATLEMMLKLVGYLYDTSLATEVGYQFHHPQVLALRDGERDKRTVSLRLRVHEPSLIKVVEIMEQNIEFPLEIEELAKDLPISRRQLERLFRKHLNDTLTGYYLKLRLRSARELLQQTSMSVFEVALASGFASAPYFSRAYKNRFGVSPRADRQKYLSSYGRSGIPEIQVANQIH